MIVSDALIDKNLHGFYELKMVFKIIFEVRNVKLTLVKSLNQIMKEKSKLMRTM